MLQASVCQKATHIVSKVLRVTTGAYKELLHDIPKLKVIHLFRDPRAVIHSRLETHGYPIKRTSIASMKSNIKANAKSLCTKMATDLKEGKQLQTLFPDRFRFIHYEDLYTLDNSLISLHTYLGMPISNRELQFARTHKSNSGNRRDSASRQERQGNNAFWWRKYISWDTVQLVDAECSHLYTELGYPTVQLKDMHTFNETAIIENLKFSFVRENI